MGILYRTFLFKVMTSKDIHTTDNNVKKTIFAHNPLVLGSSPSGPTIMSSKTVQMRPPNPQTVGYIFNFSSNARYPFPRIAKLVWGNYWGYQE